MCCGWCQSKSVSSMNSCSSWIPSQARVAPLVLSDEWRRCAFSYVLGSKGKGWGRGRWGKFLLECFYIYSRFQGLRELWLWSLWVRVKSKEIPRNMESKDSHCHLWKASVLGRDPGEGPWGGVHYLSRLLTRISRPFHSDILVVGLPMVFDLMKKTQHWKQL